MFPRIAWELVAGPLGSTDHNLGTTGLEETHSQWWQFSKAMV
jgi:hypothetical protein